MTLGQAGAVRPGECSWWRGSGVCSGELCLYSQCQPPLLTLPFKIIIILKKNKKNPPAATKRLANALAGSPRSTPATTSAGNRPAVPPRSDCPAAIPAPGSQRSPLRFWGGGARRVTLPAPAPPAQPPRLSPGRAGGASDSPRAGLSPSAAGSRGGSPAAPAAAVGLPRLSPGLQLTLIFRALLNSPPSELRERSRAEPSCAKLCQVKTSSLSCSGLSRGCPHPLRCAPQNPP